MSMLQAYIYGISMLKLTSMVYLCYKSKGCGKFREYVMTVLDTQCKWRDDGTFALKDQGCGRSKDKRKRARDGSS